MRDTLCALLAVLVLLAGCSMPATDSEPDGVESVTPVPVTDAESVDRVTTAADRSPPWGDGGPFADVLDDHEATLSNTAYAFRINRTSRGDLFSNRTVSGYRAADGSAYLHQRRSERGRELAWSNGSIHVTGLGDGSGTSYEVSERARREPFDSVRYLRQTLTFAEPTETTENETHYHIDAVFVPRDGRSVFGPGMTTANTTLSLTVSKEGVVESYRFEVRGHYRKGDYVHVVERFTLDRSADTLPRPEWVERALADDAGEPPTTNRSDRAGE